MINIYQPRPSGLLAEHPPGISYKMPGFLCARRTSVFRGAALFLFIKKLEVAGVRQYPLYYFGSRRRLYPKGGRFIAGTYNKCIAEAIAL